MAYARDDTIIAIATPAGRGGIGVVRVSGPEACRVAGEMMDGPPGPPRRATIRRLIVDRRDRLAAAADRGDARGRVRGCGAGRGREAIDEVVAVHFEAPASYTGEDVVELSTHGSPAVLGEVLRAGVEAGARLAEPGEFTLRAFLNGRMDLVQAEAVADLVEAVTPVQARAAFDQLQGTLTASIARIERELFDVAVELEASMDVPEAVAERQGGGERFGSRERIEERLGAVLSAIDGLVAVGGRGRVIREGRQVTILGRPNAGKSSLFNRLVGCDRAIVAAVPGTTRDLISEVVDLGGVRVTLVDTAGFRVAGDDVEQEGVRRARKAATVADVAVVMLDWSRPLGAEDQAVLRETKARARVIVANKQDLGPAWDLAQVGGGAMVIAASMKTGEGVERICGAVGEALLGPEPLSEVPGVTNVRHLALLARAREAVARAREASAGGVPEEFVAADVKEGRGALEEVTGRRTTEGLLDNIFSRFCVGK